MAWTADVKSVSKNRFMILPIVTFTNQETGETFNETLQADDITLGRLAEIVKQKIKSLESRDKSAVTIVQGSIDLTPKNATADEKDSKIFFDDLYELNTLLSAEQKEIIPKFSNRVIDLKNSLATRLRDHPEYLKDFRWR